MATLKRNHWLAVSEHPELLVGQYIVPNFVSNSVAIRTSEQHFTLVSPGESLLESWPHQISKCRVDIVLPNHFHYLGAAAWLARFPNCKVYATRKAIPRLSKQGIKDILAVDDASPTLPDGYQLVVPPGHRGGDLWIVKTGETDQGLWITCDSFLNYSRLSNQPVARTMQKLLGAAPGLKLSQVIKWFILDNRKAFKNWALDFLEREPPTMLIPSHGEIASAPDLSQQLKSLIASRL